MMEMFIDKNTKAVKKPVTLSEFISEASAYLRKKGIDEARLNCELMLCDILGYDRMGLYLNFDRPLSRVEIDRFRTFLARRAAREPLQYILGKTNFFGYEFIVDKSVLIPRPETEQLVEKILYDISREDGNKVMILEIGTGSGCIAVTLGKELDRMNRDYGIMSIDISESAIETAKKNLLLNGSDTARISLLVKDVFEFNDNLSGFNYIVSNPPYISGKDYDNLQPELKNFEPVAALTDHEDGLRFYERILTMAVSGNFKGRIYFETGIGASESLSNMLNTHGMLQFQFYRDYNNIDRILRIDVR